ncbi:MAG: DUF4340 domain-containing protein [Planctomycetota bacterium]|jgi:hypothetical protein
MNETVRSLIFVAGALLLVGAAWLTRPSPPQLEQFSDQGEPFYPGFTDPLAAASLEVIDYHEVSGTARPFKVQVQDGRWSIPSHYDYPADGEDRLARTAAAIIDVHRDVVQSDRVQDHERLGVIDPLDETTPTLRGRGQRVTLRDVAGTVLAEFIIGGAVEGKPRFRYVRLPGQKRTYAAKIDVDLSTNFVDWIDTDLLDLEAESIVTIEVNDYSIDETTGTVNRAGGVLLTKLDGSTWTMQGQPPDTQLDAARITSATTALAGVTIRGVRPKPASLSADLQMREGITLDLPTQLSLQSRGFFVSPDGRLLSNEGEMSVGMRNGVRYTLRFGEVLYGEGLDVSAGRDDDANEAGESGPSAGQAENRYLFVTAAFDESLLPPKPSLPSAGETPALDEDDQAQPAPESDDDESQDAATALSEWESLAESGREVARQLNNRFAPWYYVISAADFRSIRMTAGDLLEPTEPGDRETDPNGAGGAPTP